MVNCVKLGRSRVYITILAVLIVMAYFCFPSPVFAVDWWERDFKVEYEYRPALGTAILTGNSSISSTERHKVVRVGNVVYRHYVTSELSGDYHYLYRMEGGQVIMYVFNPANKEAIRQVLDARDLNAAMRSHFRENLASDLGRNMEKQRTETFAGVECDVYVLNTQTDQSNTAALADLAARLGGRDVSERIQGMQMAGTRTVWVGKRDGILMRALVQSNNQGQQSSTDQWRVSLFQTANINPREVAYNMNEYNVTNR